MPRAAVEAAAASLASLGFSYCCGWGIDAFDVANRRTLFEWRRGSALLVADDLQRRGFAFSGGKRVARGDLETIALEIRENPVAVALVFELHGQRVFAGHDAA